MCAGGGPSPGEGADAIDWSKAMEAFQQRASSPSSLETLRKIALETDAGQVLYCEDDLAIVAHLNNDADVGTR